MKTFVAAVILLLGACSGTPPERTVSTPTGMPKASPALEGEVLAPRVTVLDDGHGPELCLGAIAESYPPQCGGPAIRNWSWGDHKHQRAAGVRWGFFTLVGTWDGAVFTYRRNGKPPKEREPELEFASPCKPPSGGWRAADPSRTGPSDLEGALQAVSKHPHLGGVWVDTRKERIPGSAEPSIINAKVTRGAAEARHMIRAHWGGALCVSKARHTEKELRKVQSAVEAVGGFLGAGTDIINETVDLQVIFDDGSIQSWADATYGDGLVHVQSRLVPAN